MWRVNKRTQDVPFTSVDNKAQEYLKRLYARDGIIVIQPFARFLCLKE
jgi:hypothetical protein